MNFYGAFEIILSFIIRFFVDLLRICLSFFYFLCFFRGCRMKNMNDFIHILPTLLCFDTILILFNLANNQSNVNKWIYYLLWNFSFFSARTKPWILIKKSFFKMDQWMMIGLFCSNFTVLAHVWAFSGVI